eukprot:Gb_28178 [translate_table: standard]
MAFAWVKLSASLTCFIKAKSEIALEDVMVLVEVGLELFLQSENLYVQVRWGNLLARLVKKFGKKLDLTIQWRPFYDLLIQTHFARHQSAEGLRLMQDHVETMASLIRASRQFFPSGSAAEIWLEFRLNAHHFQALKTLFTSLHPWQRIATGHTRDPTPSTAPSPPLRLATYSPTPTPVPPSVPLESFQRGAIIDNFHLFERE